MVYVVVIPHNLCPFLFFDEEWYELLTHLNLPVAAKAEKTLFSGHRKISVIHTVIRRKTFENEVIKTTDTSSFWELLHNQ